MNKKKNQIRGTLNSIRYQQDSFIIGDFSNNAGPPSFFSILGDMINPQVGMEYNLTGEWYEDPVYKLQFKFKSFETIKPSDLQGIYKYIVRICKFVGPSVGQSIIDKYGERTLDVMKKYPLKLSKNIKGLTQERAIEIQKSLRENEENEKLMVELEAILNVPGMHKNVAPRLIEMFQSSAAEILKNNPYILTNVKGIGFSLADRVALANSFDRESIYRKRAACLHVISEIMTTGSVWVPRKKLVDDMKELIHVANVMHGVDSLVKDKRIVRQPGIGNVGLYALPGPYEDECLISKKIIEMLREK